MKRQFPTLAACAVALVLPASLTASAVTLPLRGDARAWLVTCRTGADAMARSLTVDSTMRSLRRDDRMQMRFTLLQRLPGTRRFRRLPGPGLGVWNSATPGVLRFRFRKPIENLPAPAVYYVKVHYRWRTEDGRTFARTARATRVCRQPDLRADLRVAYVGVPRRTISGTWTYPVVVHNAGRATAREFDAVVTVGDAPQPARRVAGLAPGERRTVELTGSRCPSGAPATVQLDPDNRVDESDERNNVRSFACP